MSTLSKSEPVLIFIGPGRSGSTVISEIIMMHEQLAWPSNFLEYLPSVPAFDYLRRVFDNRLWHIQGEKSQLNKTLLFNSLIPRPAEAYRFWERLTRTDINFSRGFLLGKIASQEEKQRICSAITRLKSRQNRHYFTMKITGPGRIGYLQSLFPQARFVNITRDPVATVNSLLKVPFWEKLGMHRLWWTGAYSATELLEYEQLKADPALGTAFQLRKLMETTTEEASITGAEMLDIRFEDFMAAPDYICNKILNFAHLPPSARVDKKLANFLIHDRHSTDCLSPRQESLIQQMFATTLSV